MHVHCLGYLYKMMKSTMGYTSTNNYVKPSYFPSNSICQHNQNSKMCWHDPEHMTETYYRSQCTTPAKNKTKELLYAVQYCQKPLWLTLAKNAELEYYFLDLSSFSTFWPKEPYSRGSIYLNSYVILIASDYVCCAPLVLSTYLYLWCFSRHATVNDWKRIAADGECPV